MNDIDFLIEDYPIELEGMYYVMIDLLCKQNKVGTVRLEYYKELRNLAFSCVYKFEDTTKALLEKLNKECGTNFKFNKTTANVNNIIINTKEEFSTLGRVFLDALIRVFKLD